LCEEIKAGDLREVDITLGKYLQFKYQIPCFP